LLVTASAAGAADGAVGATGSSAAHAARRISAPAIEARRVRVLLSPFVTTILFDILNLMGRDVDAAAARAMDRTTARLLSRVLLLHGPSDRSS